MINYQFINKNGELEWGKREPTLEELADMEQEEVVETDWLHPYHLRIVAPRSLTSHPVGIAMFVHFSIEGLPIVRVGEDLIHIYCNEVMEEHQSLIEELQGVIMIEYR